MAAGDPSEDALSFPRLRKPRTLSKPRLRPALLQPLVGESLGPGHSDVARPRASTPVLPSSWVPLSNLPTGGFVLSLGHRLREACPVHPV